MTQGASQVSSEHKAMLIHEFLQAGIVLVVVACATALTLVKPAVISTDLLSFVYGGALTYAGGRASSARQALRRSGDSDAGS